jgi:hypothetical protein
MQVIRDLLRFFVVPALLVPAVGCSSGPASSAGSGSGTGSGTATGTVGGASLSVRTAISVHVAQALGEEWAVLVMDLPLSCGDLQKAVRSGSVSALPGTILALQVVSSNLSGGAPTPIGPGTYSTSPPAGGDPNGDVTGVMASFGKSQPDACSTAGDDATDGTLTIAAVDGSHIAGSYDLTFADGSLHGTFDAPTCDIPLTGPADAGCSQ